MLSKPLVAFLFVLSLLLLPQQLAAKDQKDPVKKEVKQKEKTREKMKRAKQKKKGAIPGILTKEEIEEARKNKEVEELLQMRLEADAIYTEFWKLAMARGVEERQLAMKEGATLNKKIRRLLKQIEATYSKSGAPIEKDLDKVKSKEGKLLNKLQKLEDKKKDTDEVEKELDALQTQIQLLEEQQEMLFTLGLPEYNIGNPDILLLFSVMKPNEQIEATIKGLVKKYPDLLAGRIQILHLQYDLDRALKGDSTHEPNPELASKLKRQLKGVDKKYTKYFFSIWEPLMEEQQEKKKTLKKLQKKVDSLGDKPSGRKYQHQLARENASYERTEKTVQTLRKILTGTRTGEILSEMLKKEKEEKKKKQ